MPTTTQHSEIILQLVNETGIWSVKYEYYEYKDEGRIKL